MTQLELINTMELATSLEPEMVSIPSGIFLMGSPDKEGYENEYPQHEVTVQSFRIGKYPVTQAQYEAVMGNNPSHFKGNPSRPVEQVNWYDAVEFCDKLSQLTSKKYRLPSEAEWEYACRAGSTTKFSFGDDESQLGSYAWFQDNSNYTTHPVGSKKPNAFGLYDLHGQVWEWCADHWHSSYDGAPNDGSAWTKGGTKNRSVRRGGSWRNRPDYCRSAIRDTPSGRGDCYGDMGFRVVCGLGEK